MVIFNLELCIVFIKWCWEKCKIFNDNKIYCDFNFFYKGSLFIMFKVYLDNFYFILNYIKFVLGLEWFWFMVDNLKVVFFVNVFYLMDNLIFDKVKIVLKIFVWILDIRYF